LELDTLVMIQTKFGFHWSSTFRGEDFWKSLRRTTDDGRQVMGKNDQHILQIWWKKGNNSKMGDQIYFKIYLPCNFEVNLITHLGVIALFSSNL
jgi:hypothetical protein